MNTHPLIAVAVASAITFLLLLFYLIRRYNHCFKTRSQPPPIQRASSLQTGITKLHQRETIFNNKRRTNYYIIRRGFSSKHLFNWSDHPSLVTDAVENGWSRFAFTNFTSSPSIQSSKSILGYCGPAADEKDTTNMVEIGWEVCEGSVDFMQKIRFISGLRKVVTTTGGSSIVAGSVIRSALPLPGPALGNLNSNPFPQEAYFEITILSIYDNEIEAEPDGEKVKLIQEKGAGEKVSSESLIHVTSSNSNSNSNNNGNGTNTTGILSKEEELKEKLETGVVMTVGLAGGGLLPLKLPGSYPGSIGFNSDGSVYLEGVKLKTELEYEEWGKAEKVIGCGYNPSQKRVYFTVDGKLVREAHCTTEDFETPLYPILAANISVTVLVNFGQVAFKYTQANLHRTPNPCFIGQSANSPILGFEDSRELFSMGRIDAHWLDRSTKRNAQYFGSVNRGMSDYDESSDGDLFEIVLDNNSRGRSPSMHL